MRKLLATIALSTTFILLHVQANAGDSLKVAMNPEFTPFQLQVDGKPAGIDIDIINAIAKKMNLSVEFTTAPWVRCIEMMRDGEADMVGYLVYREDRAAFMDYLKPAYQADVKVFYVRKGEKDKLKKIEDLHNLKVGLVRGMKHFEAFDNDSKIQKVEVNKMEQAFMMLENGRIDAIVGNEAELTIQIKKSKLAEKFEAAEYSLKMDRNGFFALSKKSKLLPRKAEFEKYLKELIDSGEIDKIIKNGIKKYS